MGNMVRKWICLCLAAAMLCSGCFAGAAQQGGAWYDAAVQSAVENGLLMGDADGLSPEKNLTRAQLAAILVRAFSAKEEADLSAYADVDQDAWYYHAMAQAVEMGIFEGSGNSLYPDAPVTREEVFKVLTECFQLPDKGEDRLKDFPDNDQVSGWARQPANAMIAAGYVQGADGAIAPKEPITRAEFAQVMYRMVQGYCSSGGTYTELPPGNVVINTADVSLKDTVIQGDLILADGVGLNDIDLSGVTVTGRVLIRGGGLVATGETALPLVQVASPRGETRISTENGAKVEKVQADTPVVIAGKAGTVEAQSKVTVEKGAAVESLVLSGAAVQAEISGSVEKLSTTETAANAAIEVRQGGEVEHAVVQADGVTVAGSGTVKQVTADAEDVHVQTGNTKVVATENAGSVSVGKETIASGNQATSNENGSGVKPDKPSGDKRPSRPSVIAVSGVALTPEKVTLDIGGSAALTAVVSPENATEKGVLWASENETVASVDAEGRVTALSPGTAAITATTKDGGFTASCTVTVQRAVVHVTGVTVMPEAMTLEVGEQETLTAAVAPEDATEKSVTWASGDTAVASVDTQGRVTALSPGTAAITATTADGGFIARCAVTVNGPKTWYAGGETASDENSGLAAEQAFATVQAAIDHAKDGDTIVICGSVSLGEQGTLTEIEKGLTFTSKTETGDYTQTGLLAFEDDLSFGGETVFRDIHIDIVRTLDVFANGYPMTFDEGVETHDRSAGYIADRSLYLYGGGCNTDCDETSITIRSGRIYNVFGGGKATKAGASAQVSGDTSIVITGGYVDDSIVGGGETYANDTNVDVLGSTHIEISGSDFDMGWYDRGNSINCGTIYGGGWATNRNGSAQVMNGVKINLEDTGEIFAEIFGGGHTDVNDANATVGGVDIELYNAGLGDQYVYGGGMVFNNGSPVIVDGDVSISVTNGVTGAVIGGGASASGRVCYTVGDTNITLTQCEVKEAIVGSGVVFDNNGDTHTDGDVTITLSDVTVPDILCSGLTQGKGTEDVSIGTGRVVISGSVETKNGSIDAGDCKNGCTVRLESGAAPHFAAFDNWFYADETTNISNFAGLEGAEFTWKDSKWICDRLA